MASSKKLAPTIRLSGENLKELEPLAKLGLNYGGLVNEALKEGDHLKRAVQRKLKSMKAALAEV